MNRARLSRPAATRADQQPKKSYALPLPHPSWIYGHAEAAQAASTVTPHEFWAKLGL